MDEKAALNRQLAELLGWTHIRAEMSHYPTWNEATDWLEGVPPNGWHHARLPDFAGSCDATLATLPERGVIVQLFRSGDDFVAQLIEEAADACFDGRSAEDYAPALAAARLAMAQAEAKQHGE